jgi:hypothetical protein
VGALTRTGALVGLAVAAAAVACVLVLGRGSSAAGPAPTAPLVVSASFEPPAVSFGDRVIAHVVVLLDRGSVRTATLRLSDDITPLTTLAAPATTTVSHGRLTVVSVAIAGACLTQNCVVAKGDAELKLPHVVATVSTRGGRTLHATVAWPLLDIHSGITAADLAPVNPPFRVGTTPAPPSYRLAPSALAALLDALAVILVLAGVALGASQLARLAHSRRRDRPAGGELERAIRLARLAEARPAPDRRRALALLARLLGARDNRLAGAADDLAWSRGQPESGELAELVGEIEREVVS